VVSSQSEANSLDGEEEEELEEDKTQKAKKESCVIND